MKRFTFELRNIIFVIAKKSTFRSTLEIYFVAKHEYESDRGIVIFHIIALIYSTLRNHFFVR